jgi:rhodanese-related sulfurtransferase
MLKKIITASVIASAILTTTASASEFVSYKQLSSKLKKENKANGNYATTADVRKALTSKDWIVADVRTKEEWAGAHIKGSVRIGRQAPEKALGNFVLDEDDKFVKPNLIVICNSAARASIEAETFRKMGFKTVKVYDIYTWIDTCNPVVTSYTVKKLKSGTGLKFGQFFASHCTDAVKKQYCEVPVKK